MADPHGRQQFYQDHPWMLGFGEAMCAYRPPVDMKTVEPIIGQKPNGNPEIVLNFITRTRSGASTAPTPTTC